MKKEIFFFPIIKFHDKKPITPTKTQKKHPKKMARTMSIARSSTGDIPKKPKSFSPSKKDITVKKSILKAKAATIYPLKKTIAKKKIYKKTPLKSQTKELIVHSKRQTKKTERAIESAEQAKLFQTLKIKAP